jgi:hypothetical protein
LVLGPITAVEESDGAMTELPDPYLTGGGATQVSAVEGPEPDVVLDGIEEGALEDVEDAATEDSDDDAIDDEVEELGAATDGATKPP